MNRLMFGAAIVALTTGMIGSAGAQTAPSQQLQPASCTQLDVGEVANRVDRLQGERKAQAEMMIQRARDASNDGDLNECRNILADLERTLPGGQQVTKETPLPAILGGEGGGTSSARGGVNPQQAPIQADNVMAALRENRQFSTLVGLIDRAGMAETLSQSGPYTVFAPTNAAFDKLPQNVRDQLNQDQNRDQLRALLSQHVVQNQSIASNAIPQELRPMGGGPIDVSLTNGRPRLHVGEPQPPSQNQSAQNQSAQNPNSVQPVTQTAVNDQASGNQGTDAASPAQPMALQNVRDARTSLEAAEQTLRADTQDMQAVQDSIANARQSIDQSLQQARDTDRDSLQRAGDAIDRARQAIQSNDRDAARQAVNDALLPVRQVETAMAPSDTAPSQTAQSSQTTTNQTAANQTAANQTAANQTQAGNDQRMADRRTPTPAQITVGDIRTGNGFVQGIDQVLMPDGVQEALAQ